MAPCRSSGATARPPTGAGGPSRRFPGRWSPAIALKGGRGPARRRIDSPRPAPPHGRAPASNLEWVRGSGAPGSGESSGDPHGLESPWVGPVSCDAAKHYAGSRGRSGHEWILTAPPPLGAVGNDACAAQGEPADGGDAATGKARILLSHCLGVPRLATTLGMVSIDVRLPVDANMRR
jgi:hypothetical protein